MEQKTNNEVMDVEVKEVIVTEEQTEVKGLIPKAKDWFKKNRKKIVKVAAIGGGILAAGIVLGKRHNGQSEVIDIPEEDITEYGVSEDENIA